MALGSQHSTFEKLFKGNIPFNNRQSRLYQSANYSLYLRADNMNDYFTSYSQRDTPSNNTVSYHSTSNLKIFPSQQSFTRCLIVKTWYDRTHQSLLDDTVWPSLHEPLARTLSTPPHQLPPATAATLMALSHVTVRNIAKDEMAPQ